MWRRVENINILVKETLNNEPKFGDSFNNF